LVEAGFGKPCRTKYVLDAAEISTDWRRFWLKAIPKRSWANVENEVKITRIRKVDSKKDGVCIRLFWYDAF
jgi:hypothetical protein